MIDNEYCGVCEQCVPKCPKDLIIKIGYTMKVRDGCDDHVYRISPPECDNPTIPFHKKASLLKSLTDLLELDVILIISTNFSIF